MIAGEMYLVQLAEVIVSSILQGKPICLQYPSQIWDSHCVHYASVFHTHRKGVPLDARPNYMLSFLILPIHSTHVVSP